MEKESKILANELLKFIDASPVSYFAVKNMITELEEAGYKMLNEGDKWKLEDDGKYYIQRNLSSLIAFNIGSSKPWDTGFKIAGAHTDSPLLKAKNESLEKKAGCLKLNVEPYGGGIINTWLDRDLSLAGKITVETKNGIVSQLIDFKKPIGTIPNLAIHLNREVNKGFEYNKQTHLNVVLHGGVDSFEDDITLKAIVAKEFNIDVDTILEMDLYFYDTQNGSLTGLNEDMISIGKLDDLSMCHAITKSLLDSKETNSTKIAVFFDNEEVGSNTMMGADSNFLSSLLERIIFSTGGDLEDLLRAKNKSFLISADGAHAGHPNFLDKHDSSYTPIINKGPVIKLSANFRYATTSESAAKFISLCKKTDVPYQKIANRSDVPSGSTIGPMSSASLGIETVDVGNPMFAMHSIRESQGVLDHYYMTKVLTEFFSSN
ncbi:MAG: M18 family aminopeptidase [Spirochaetaceae bacterium]